MKIFLGILGLIALFVAWRMYATVVGGGKAYAKLLDRIAPITDALAAGRDPSAADLLAFAKDRRTRRVLYDALSHEKKLNLFPRAFLTWDAIAEADLVTWLNHPNELGSPPDEIELMGKVRAPRADGQYFVFRFRMRPPHWSAKRGWLAGVAGPYDVTQEPRPVGRNTFSQFDPYDSHTPEQHVEKIDRMLGKRR